MPLHLMDFRIIWQASNTGEPIGMGWGGGSSLPPELGTPGSCPLRKRNMDVLLNGLAFNKAAGFAPSMGWPASCSLDSDIQRTPTDVTMQRTGFPIEIKSMLGLRRLLCFLQGFVSLMRGGRPRRRHCSGRFYGRHQSDPQRNERHRGFFQALCGPGRGDRAACELRHLPGAPIDLSRVSRNLGKRLPQRHLRPGPVELRAAAVR